MVGWLDGMNIEVSEDSDIEHRILNGKHRVVG